MKIISLVTALLLSCQPVHADTPPPGTVNAKLQSGSGTPITSTVTSGKTGIEFNITNPSGLPTTVNQGNAGSSPQAWYVQGSLGRTWTLLNTTDSVNVGNFPAAFGRTWTLSNGSDSVSSVQSGTWTTGRTWSLLNTTDSVNVGNFPATFAVTQSTSPWIVSGNVTVTGSGTFSVTQSTTPWIVSAASLPLPTGASTAANQATEIASLASIDTKLTNPIPVTGPLTDTELRASPVPVSAAQSGTWTTGRTWSLLNTTDSVNVGNFPATVAVTQSTSPWVVSGTVTANAGTGTFLVDGSAHTQPVSGTVTATQGTSPWIVSGTVSPSTNTNSNLSARQTVTGTESNVQAPANTVGVVVECESINADSLRWGFSNSVGNILSATLGMLCEPGRDSGYLPLGAGNYLHLIATGGGSDFADVQWVLSQ